MSSNLPLQYPQHIYHYKADRGVSETAHGTITSFWIIVLFKDRVAHTLYF